MVHNRNVKGAAKAFKDTETIKRVGLLMVLAVATSAIIAASLHELTRHQLPIFEAPDRFTYDWRQALFAQTEPQSRKDIALLLISDRSLEQYSSLQPIDRKLLANVVDALDADGAKVIGLDIIFDRPTDKDELLISAIRNSTARVVLGAFDRRMARVDQRKLAFQQSFFNRAGNPSVGHLYFYQQKRTLGLSQPDQVIRFLPARSVDPRDVRKSFAEALVEASGREVKNAGEHIAWLALRADNGAETFETFEVPALAPETVTPDMILRPEWRGQFKDKIVIVGGDFEDRDRHLTPLSVIDGARVPGAFIYAQMAAQLADGRSLHGLTDLQELIVGFLLALLGTIGGRFFGFKDREPVVYVIGLIGLVLVGAWLFKAHSIILPSDTAFYSLFAGMFVGHYSRRLLNSQDHERGTILTSEA
jgi:CHASE2 domain-containing sensor protein